MAEEQLLLKHYQATLQHICQELRFPRKVLGTAVQYMKRFYLAHSTLDQDPQYIVVVCLYLACKVRAECYVCGVVAWGVGSSGPAWGVMVGCTWGVLLVC